MKVVSEQELRIATLSGAVVLLQPGVEREVADEIGTRDDSHEIVLIVDHGDRVERTFRQHGGRVADLLAVLEGG